METNYEQQLADIRAHLEKHKISPPTRWRKVKDILKKTALIGSAVAAIGLIPSYYLAKDFLLKRQNYPERNVLYRSSNVVHVSGGSEIKGERNTDRESEIKVYEGGEESKVGTYLFRTVRELRDDIEYFNMDDSQKIRIASATRKPENVQAGLHLRGSLTFKEQLAEIITGKETKSPQKYMTYDFVPERGLQEKEITVVMHQDHRRTLENRMTEVRSFPFGWMFGKEFRAGTFLESYVHSPKNLQNMDGFLALIKELNSRETEDISKREAMMEKVLTFEDERLERFPTISSFEDGIFDILPQGSTIYLGYKPGSFERMKHTLGFGGHDHHRLRVDTYWDLWPGNIPILNKISFGSGDNIAYPFDKYNNGGYILRDAYGDLAQIDIKDFILYYGQDVVYSYYLDLNGDGRIDKEHELLGHVLCRTTHDEKINLEKLIGEGKPKNDISFTVHYSFMGPDEDHAKGRNYFNLCGYLESFIPDQINRGYGKHSLLGYINESRGDIMLYRDLAIENVSRAMTEESTLVAPHDVIRVLIAAQRPYAEDVAHLFGIAQDFSGKYTSSPLAVERTEYGPLPGVGVGILAGVGFLYYRKRRKQQRASLKTNC